MQKTRRIGAFIALATAAVGAAATVTAAPAGAAPRGPEPVSNWLQSVRANTGSWVSIQWRTDRPICDAEVRVRGERVRVDYPGFARSAEFSRGDSLRPGRIDSTRIKVTPYLQRPGVARLWATISYDECGFRARTQTRTAALSLPVLRNTGPVGQGGPGGPGHGQPGGPNHDGPGAPGHGGPGQGPDGPRGPQGPGQGGPGQHTPGGGQGAPGGQQAGAPQPTVTPTTQPTAAPQPAATQEPAAAQPTGTPQPTGTRTPGGPQGGGQNGGGQNGGGPRGGGSDGPRH
jgi:hypothetical protein